MSHLTAHRRTEYDQSLTELYGEPAVQFKPDVDARLFEFDHFGRSNNFDLGSNSGRNDLLGADCPV
jgi:hypothetical protein